MIETSLSSPSTGWVAIAAGAAGLLGLVFLVLFFTVGQPFGSLNDICIGLAAVLSIALAWMTYPAFHARAPLLSQVGLACVILGALVVVTGSVLVVSGRTGWFLAGLYMAAGYGLIGLWLVGLNYSAQPDSSWPSGLVIFGFISGLCLLLGLASIPGILRGADAMDAAPQAANLLGQAGSLGYLLLYPIWCVLVGRTLL